MIRRAIACCALTLACCQGGCGDDPTTPADPSAGTAVKTETLPGEDLPPPEDISNPSNPSENPDTGTLPPLPGDDNDNDAPSTIETIANLGGRAEELSGVVVKAIFSDNPVNDDDLALFEELPELKKLYLSNTLITDAGLAHLYSLEELQVLDLNFSSVGDAGMAHVGKLHSLKELSLFRTDVGDLGVAHLSQLPQLEDLKLQRTKVTDESIPYLSKLTSLKQLWLGDTAVSAEGIAKLRMALPNTRIRD